MRQLQSSLLQGMVKGRGVTNAILVFIFLNVFSINLFAQQPITGTVSSKEASLPGVTVTVKGSSVSTLRNIIGCPSPGLRYRHSMAILLTTLVTDN